MRRKKRHEEDPSVSSGRVTPSDVQQVEFRLAFRGYSERDVDAFLDRVTEDLASYIEETERLRALSAGVPIASPSAGSGPTAAEAEAVVARAREEASEIVRRAQEEAVAIRDAGGDDRAAVRPFLIREREFLQGLGSLVQSHAEEIRRMVLDVRAHSEAQPGDASASGSPSPPSDEGPDVEGEGGGGPETEPIAVPDEPVVIPDEPVHAVSPEGSEPGGEDVDVAEEGDEPALSSEAPAEPRERSLRELFWGEG